MKSQKELIKCTFVKCTFSVISKYFENLEKISLNGFEENLCLHFVLSAGGEKLNFLSDTMDTFSAMDTRFFLKLDFLQN